MVADIAFCRLDDREQAIQILHDTFPELTPRWEFFENDVQQCSINIFRSGRPSASRIQKLSEIAPQYSPPTGVSLMPVWRENK